MNTTFSRSGFSLIEVMVVIVIIGILAGVVALSVMDAPDEAASTATAAQMVTLKTALKRYHLRFGSYPTSAQGLEALIRKPSKAPVPTKDYPPSGFLDTERIPTDGWDNPFVYSFDVQSRQFEIVSLGADGEPGGEGAAADISSREL